MTDSKIQSGKTLLEDGVPPHKWREIWVSLFQRSTHWLPASEQMKSLVNASPLKIRNLRATHVNCRWRVLAEDKLAGGVAEFDMFLRNAEIRN